MIQEELIIKMSISEKIKAINNKTEQNKAQCHLAWQTAEISALLSENNNKYEFLTSKDVLPKKDSLEKAAMKKGWIFSIRQRIEKVN